ncbi:hypothetical protein GCM10023324_47310 [Streptomyces youssoufiensis]
MAEPVRVRRLTDQEGQKPQRIGRRGSTSSVRYRRAMMLLASAGGNRVPVVAQLVQAEEDTVRDVIHRLNEIGLACLDPRRAGGRPRLLSTELWVASGDSVVGRLTVRWGSQHRSPMRIRRPDEAGSDVPRLRKQPGPTAGSQAPRINPYQPAPTRTNPYQAAGGRRATGGKRAGRQAACGGGWRGQGCGGRRGGAAPAGWASGAGAAADHAGEGPAAVYGVGGCREEGQ